MQAVAHAGSDVRVCAIEEWLEGAALLWLQARVLLMMNARGCRRRLKGSSRTVH